VIPSTFDYQRATSVQDAIARLKAAPGSKLIAGGHSLVPAMKLRLSEPAALIDVARIPGLSGVREDGGVIEIGACTTHHDVAASTLVRERCPVVAEAAASIGDPQVRNRGTLGGSLAHADPSADYPAAMLAADAEIRIEGANGSRSVSAAAFFQGLFTVDLAPDEMVVSVRLASAPISAYAKLYQRASHYAVVGVAAALDASGGAIRLARVGITGAGTHAVRLSAVEQALQGQPATTETLERASALATLADVNEDVHASQTYRRAMMQVFTRRALEAAMARA
jgi:aerobic carbon-monoxide dehydrogenase medium subunit